MLYTVGELAQLVHELRNHLMVFEVLIEDVKRCAGGEACCLSSTYADPTTELEQAQASLVKVKAIVERLSRGCSVCAARKAGNP